MHKLKELWNRVCTERCAAIGADLSPLVLRLSVAGLMLFAHGWGKLINFGDRMHSFSDPLGIGSPLSLSLAIFAEVFCAILVMLGLFTRAACVPLMITMLVAAFIVHWDDPFRQKEFALLFFFPFLALSLTGAGKFSLDAKLGIR